MTMTTPGTTDTPTPPHEMEFLAATRVIRGGAAAYQAEGQPMQDETDTFRRRAELRRQSRVIPVRCAGKRASRAATRQTAARAGTVNRFSSRSRPALPAEILGGFSSSLLPPSFPRGRSATFFFEVRRPARCRPFSRRAASFVVGAR
ncbi:MAG TPA: hypothetical protein VII31_10195 [Caldimonas sp.]